jgi:hypothetical protein
MKMRGEWRNISTHSYHHTRWRQVPSFTSRQLHPRRKDPRLKLDGGMGASQSRSGLFVEREKSLAMLGMYHRVLAV